VTPTSNDAPRAAARVFSFALFAALAALPTFARPAGAQERALDLSRFEAPLDASGFLGIQGTGTPGAGLADAALTLDHAWRPLLVQTADGRDVPVVADRITTVVAMQVGVGARFALGVAAPVVLWQSTDGRALDGRPLPAVASGDPRIVARVRLLGEGADVARERDEGPGLALQVTGWLPTGQTDAFLGEGAVRLAAQLLADFHVLGAGLGGVLGFRHRFEPRGLLGDRFGSEVELGLALKLPIPVLRDFSGLLEFRSATDTAAPFTAATTWAELALGSRIVLGDVALTGSVGLGLTSGVGTPGVRSTFGMVWSPRTHDRDGDGVTDEDDACPPLPEDRDGFEDEDGCPDPDDDGDMVLDPDDRCPREAAEEGRDDDEDGCTDPVRDADGDGREDAADACPEAAEDADGNADDDGCPDPDDDGDGVPDVRDRCRVQAEDRDGFADADGCPDPDDDFDGVPDADDRCPRLAEDRDGRGDDDGCPDPDDDFDGVPDARDACATEPESINGVSDDDGCPDRGGRPLWRASGTPSGPDARLVGTLAFGRGGTLAASTTPALDQLAATLRGWLVAQPRWRLALAENGAITLDARSSALLDALRARGVDVERVQIVGDAAVRNAQVVVSPTSPPSSASAP
jgi:OOP family OmpA-OmpF porin